MTRRHRAGFQPTIGNGAGYLVEPPAGGRGCGADWTACYPELYGTVSGWLSALQAVYSAPPGSLGLGVDATAPVSAVVVDELAAKWQAAADAGREANAVADAVHAAERDAWLPAAHAGANAVADGVTAVTAVASAAADAVHGAAQAQAQLAADGLRAAADALAAATAATAGAAVLHAVAAAP